MNYTFYSFYKAVANLKAESSKTVLSYLWWLLEPILEVGVLYLVFGLAFNSTINEFISFLFIGTVVWGWFAKSIIHSMMSIKENTPLINSIYIPKFVFPLTTQLTDFVKQLVVFFVLLVWLGVFEGLLTSTVLFLPILIFIQFILTLSIGFLLSAITPFLPDLRFIISALLQLAMFCSGIFYDVKSLPENIQTLLFFNPFLHLISFYRDILMYNRIPDLYYLTVIFVFSICLYFVAKLLMNKLDKVYARVVN